MQKNSQILVFLQKNDNKVEFMNPRTWKLMRTIIAGALTITTLTRIFASWSRSEKCVRASVKRLKKKVNDQKKS